MKIKKMLVGACIITLLSISTVSGYFFIGTCKENSTLKKEIVQHTKEINKLNIQINKINDDLISKENIIKDQKEDLLTKDNKINDLKNEIQNIKWRKQQEGQRKAPFVSTRATADEIDLLARLVEAEAGIEPYKGKVAVAQVVLNRVKDPRFPDTIKGVIYQPHQYESVSKGMLWDRPIKEDSKKAVQEALNGANVVGNCISFWADYLDPSHNLWDLPIKYKIGGHVFTDAYWLGAFISLLFFIKSIDTMYRIL